MTTKTEHYYKETPELAQWNYRDTKQIQGEITTKMHKKKINYNRKQNTPKEKSNNYKEIQNNDKDTK